MNFLLTFLVTNLTKLEKFELKDVTTSMGSNPVTITFYTAGKTFKLTVEEL